MTPMPWTTALRPLLLAALLAGLALPAPAAAQTAPDESASPSSSSSTSRLQRLRDLRRTQAANREAARRDAAAGATEGRTTRLSLGGRELLLVLPPQWPADGRRALVVALHGGMGNAGFLQTHLKLDATAAHAGFAVAYLSGSAASQRLPDRFAAWNAGTCCGAPAEQGVDDLGYVRDTLRALVAQQQISPGQVFVVGHSNGAMLAQRLLCETDVFQAGVSLAGALMVDSTCPAAAGHRVLALHGRQDRNVPPQGGRGTQGVTNVDFRSEADSQARFQRAGARYDIEWLDSDHALEHMAEAVQRSQGHTLGEHLATAFGLMPGAAKP